MMEENAIEVRNVTKRFKVYYDKGNELKEKALFWKRNRFEDRWVLKGISFDVKKGEAIGLIGHNGCGKSTTLKLLTKIIYPDDGTIEMKGRVSSLIELGAGFHPDMSGRENIYTNAAIFGLTKKEIEERLDDIIAFSELEEFIDNPVRTYSSGMYMRLAFSVAINVDADILLIDEILAVGDANFQAKCFNRLREIKAAGTTIVIVSHSLGQIEQICDRSLWIQDGLIKAEGKPRDVHPEYLNYMGEERQKIAAKEEARQKKIQQRREEEKKKLEEKQQKSGQGSNNNNELKKRTKENEIENRERIIEKTGRYGNREVEIVSVKMLNTQGVEKTVFKTGEPIDIVIEYKKNQEINDVVAGIGIFRNDGIHCYGTNTMVDQIKGLSLRKKGCIQFKILANNLLEGEYILQIVFHSEDGLYYDFIKEAKVFRSYSVYADIGVSRLNHEWQVDDIVYQVDDSQAQKQEIKSIEIVHKMTKEEIDQEKLENVDGYFTDNSWYPLEGNGLSKNRWTRDKVAKLYIRNKRMDLSLHFSNGYPKKNLYVTVCLAGIKIYEQKNCEIGNFQVNIDKSTLGTEEWLELTIQTNLLWSPSEVLGNKDVRKLGICMTGFHWIYDTDEQLERDGLKVEIIPLQDYIDREMKKTIQVCVKNISENGQIFSSTGDYPVMLAYRIFDMDGNEVIHDGMRTKLQNPLREGDSEIVELNYDIGELEAEQYYWMILTLVQENVGWLGDMDADNSAKIYIQ